MKPLLFALNALCAADAVTTHTAIARGASEAWIPSQNVWLLDGVAALTKLKSVASLLSGANAIDALMRDAEFLP